MKYLSFLLFISFLEILILYFQEILRIYLIFEEKIERENNENKINRFKINKLFLYLFSNSFNLLFFSII